MCRGHNRAAELIQKPTSQALTCIVVVVAVVAELAERRRRQQTNKTRNVKWNPQWTTKKVATKI
jgi:hypothetical protein